MAKLLNLPNAILSANPKLIEKYSDYCSQLGKELFVLKDLCELFMCFNLVDTFIFDTDTIYFTNDIKKEILQSRFQKFDKIYFVAQSPTNNKFITLEDALNNNFPYEKIYYKTLAKEILFYLRKQMSSLKINSIVQMFLEELACYLHIMPEVYIKRFRVLCEKMAQRHDMNVKSYCSAIHKSITNPVCTKYCLESLYENPTEKVVATYLADLVGVAVNKLDTTGSI